MRRGVILGLLVGMLASGCGSSTSGTVATTTAHRGSATAGFHVGLVGPIPLDQPGVLPRRGSLAQVAGSVLVLVDAHLVPVDEVAAVARVHPASHFVLVGASARAQHVPNLAGIVLKEDDAAYLAGMAAGFAAAEAGAAAGRVAWVGPEEHTLAAAFGRGVHAASPDVPVLHQWSRRIPARCKEAALTAIARGAVVVAAHGGLCAEAAASAAHDQNLPALRLADFMLPGVAAGLVARDAVRGVFHGGQDVVFGPATGAVGVRSLDPRISQDTATRVRAAAQDLARGVDRAG
jgi:basic membrane lipoprotein Med (substrate-binding protein (PBP1-ABC) superfamily)